MKRSALLLALAVFILTACEQDQEIKNQDSQTSNTPVLTTVNFQNRNAVLEVFYGVRCCFCPDAYEIAESLIDEHGNQVTVVGIHTGTYAKPTPGWADFTTSYGGAFWTQSSITGIPAGVLNRQVFAGRSMNGDTGMATSRNYWPAMVSEVIQDPSPLNIGAKAVYDGHTGELLVSIELYYTDDESGGSNWLNVALLQNDIVAKQSCNHGGGENFNHRHVLRDMITGQWGEEIPSQMTTTGSLYKQTIIYSLPSDFNGPVIPPGGGKVVPENLEIAVYVARGNTDIITGIHVPVTVK